MNITRPEEVGRNRRPFWQKKGYITLMAGVLILFLAAVALIFRERTADLGSYGYVGIFLISIMAGGTVIVPVPALAVVFIMGGILNPLFVGLAAGLGEAIGELTGYLAGYGGHDALRNKYETAYSRIEQWMKRRGSLFLFLSSVIFNPLFMLISAAAGALRFPLWKFFLLIWMGRSIKGLGVAYLGHWGLRFVFRWLGISL
jgi:membrane protein YqaA with SNARE-associated domain